MSEKLTAAQASLLMVLERCDPRTITLDEIRRYGLEPDFRRCRDAGLIVSAGYETSGKADTWLSQRPARKQTP